MNCNPSRRITNRNAKDSLVLASSFALFQFFEQLLFQVATRRLFDCAPLSCHGFFLCMAFSSRPAFCGTWQVGNLRSLRSEEHTSELQSLAYLVCRLLLEKKKK